LRFESAFCPSDFSDALESAAVYPEERITMPSGRLKIDSALSLELEDITRGYLKLPAGAGSAVRELAWMNSKNR